MTALAAQLLASAWLARQAHRADSARCFDAARQRFEPLIKPTEPRS